MSRFLTAGRIKSALGALYDTRAKAALLEFLIVKRTIKIKGQVSVAITQGEQAYLQAINELAGVWGKSESDIDIRAEKEFFNVFGQQETKTQGYRRGKHISNGTGTTIASPPWRAISDLSTIKPRVIKFVTGYEQHLANLLLKDAAGTEKPSLSEFAIWRHRRTDIDALLGTETNPAQRSKLLEQNVISECGLTAADVGELFDMSGSTISDSDLSAHVADPKAYLPNMQFAASGAANATAKCSRDLVAALAAKPFVILTGISGTGKSRSALNLAEQLQLLHGGKPGGQIFQLVAIGPDWTSPKKLLGFRTPFGQERTRPNGSKTNDSYEITETVRIILRAWNSKSTKIPHFLIFDEMNLSHVERYFAPFLSLMEAANILEDEENAYVVDRYSLAVISELLDLEDKDSLEAESARQLVDADQALKLPPNLFYVGTVNIDETTYMFSPKVLDRAHVLEVQALSPTQYVKKTGAGEQLIDLKSANEILREAIDDRESDADLDDDPSSVLDALVAKHGVQPSNLQSAKDLTLRVLEGCFRLLGPVGFEFGYRIVNEVHDYMFVWIKMQLLNGKSPSDAMNTWVDGLDRAIFQKVLPKIHGNRAALGDSLKALSAFLAGKDEGGDPAARYVLGVDRIVGIKPNSAITLPPSATFARCQAKLSDMHANLISRNYASFVK